MPAHRKARSVCLWPPLTTPLPTHSLSTHLSTSPPLTAHRSPLAPHRSHLRDLLVDEERTDSLVREHNGLYVDFSRQNVTETTMQVRAAV